MPSCLHKVHLEVMQKFCWKSPEKFLTQSLRAVVMPAEQGNCSGSSETAETWVSRDLSSRPLSSMAFAPALRYLQLLSCVPSSVSAAGWGPSSLCSFSPDPQEHHNAETSMVLVKFGWIWLEGLRGNCLCDCISLGNHAKAENAVRKLRRWACLLMARFSIYSCFLLLGKFLIKIFFFSPKFHIGSLCKTSNVILWNDRKSNVLRLF